MTASLLLLLKDSSPSPCSPLDCAALLLQRRLAESDASCGLMYSTGSAEVGPPGEVGSAFPPPKKWAGSICTFASAFAISAAGPQGTRIMK